MRKNAGTRTASNQDSVKPGQCQTRTARDQNGAEPGQSGAKQFTGIRTDRQRKRQREKRV